MPDALVFDFDGTLVDTETPHFLAWSETYIHFGVPALKRSHWSRFIGRYHDDPTLPDPARHLQQLCASTVQTQEIHEFRRLRRDLHLAQQEIRPGARELLLRARSMGLALAIASNSPRDWMEKSVGSAQLDQLFDVISCASPSRPKPDPAVYLSACTQLGVRPISSIAFEDSPTGIAAAQAAGLRTVAVRTAFFSEGDLEDADDIIDTFEDVELPVD